MADTLTRARLGGPLDSVRDTQAVFRAALDALSRPGRVSRLPVAAQDTPGNPWAAALLLTLLDHETTLWVAPPLVVAGVDAYLRQRSGAGQAPLEAAGFALAEVGPAPAAVATLDLGELIARLRRGTLAYPDEGATLVLSVPALAGEGAGHEGGVDGQDRKDEEGPVLILSGPGVPGGEARTLRVPGLPPTFAAARAGAVRDYPAGIDLFLVDGDGRLAGLPRSTHVESSAHSEDDLDGV
jgi:alpha-D-ribose 1-methylphosphonate 5-triphosphate synthase subunit PhnH